MLSIRGMLNAQSQDIPWRFAPGGNNRYDPIINPTGVISFATAENVCNVKSIKTHPNLQLLQSLVHNELHQYVEKNVSANLASKYAIMNLLLSI